MKPSDYLFPPELHRTKLSISKVLIVGSCGALIYKDKLSALIEETAFDYLLVSDPISPPPSAIDSYDFMFVQIPLRNIMTDLIIRYKDYASSADQIRFVNDFAHQEMERYLSLCLSCTNQTGLLTFVSNFVLPQQFIAPSLSDAWSDVDIRSIIHSLNMRLLKIVKSYQNVFVVDTEALSCTVGKAYFNDDFLNFYAHYSPWDPVANQNYEVVEGHQRIEPVPSLDQLYESKLNDVILCIWEQWLNYYRIVNQIDTIKLVIFDLDDTMWRGQIGEHYGDDGNWPQFHGWPTGLWEAVNHIRARGILTAIASKNNEETVRSRWDRAVLNKWVRLEDFTFLKIDWRPKAGNIADIIHEASLTPKSVLFVDDNPVERESVLAALPGIRVVGGNPLTVRRILLWSAETQVTSLSNESKNRENMMRAQIDRETTKKSLSREEFLSQLGSKVSVKELISIEDHDFPRCFELLNKTNQFNTTGIRWDRGRCINLFSSGGSFFYFSVADKYTDYGIVGLIITNESCIVQFVMSCRVLGLEIETSVLNAIMRASGRETFEARVIETEANQVCRNIFSSCGFDAVGDGCYSRADKPFPDPAAHLSIAIASAR